MWSLLSEFSNCRVSRGWKSFDTSFRSEFENAFKSRSSKNSINPSNSINQENCWVALEILFNLAECKIDFLFCYFEVNTALIPASVVSFRIFCSYELSLERILLTVASETVLKFGLPFTALANISPISFMIAILSGVYSTASKIPAYFKLRWFQVSISLAQNKHTFNWVSWGKASSSQLVIKMC